MKILVLGANGQLGRIIAGSPELAAGGEVVLASRDGIVNGRDIARHVDMAQSADLEALLENVGADVVFNAAAYTAVDRAEQEELLATRINGDALAVIGRWAAATQALVVHYSTDYVFDGCQSRPYTVEDKTAPINAYGRSKLAGERALRASGAPHFIFRTAWVYAAHGHNFLRTMFRLANERSPLRVVNDQHGTPTPAGLVARASLAAVEQWHRSATGQETSALGTYHLVSSGATTWHDFAVSIFQKAHSMGLLEAIPDIVPVGSLEFPTPAPRPRWSILDNTGFSRRFGFPLPDWRTGLDDVIHELCAEVNGRSC
ncbi:dTDP-4-dehydrorhamnose reductase [Dyella japonica]|uniref:dTDP-4-dehydrorhamnose reductase n=1 Tax=Dyella japonica TaxID=231455 RepID=A0ABV2JWV1_9GAMM